MYGDFDDRYDQIGFDAKVPAMTLVGRIGDVLSGAGHIYSIEDPRFSIIRDEFERFVETLYKKLEEQG